MKRSGPALLGPTPPGYFMQCSLIFSESGKMQISQRKPTFFRAPPCTMTCGGNVVAAEVGAEHRAWRAHPGVRAHGSAWRYKKDE